MAEKNSVEDAVYLEEDNMIYAISAVRSQDTNPTQTVYVAYEPTPSGTRLLPEVDMFSGQYVLHSDNSDMLTSIFCGDVQLAPNGNSMVEESLGGTVCPFDKGNMNNKNVICSDLPVVNNDLPVSDRFSDEDQKKASISFAASSFSSSEGKASSGLKQKPSIFSIIQATLSPDFLALADNSIRDILQKATNECCLQMVPGPETDLCYVIGLSLESLTHFEKIVSAFVDNVDGASSKFSTKSTSTEEYSKPETCDKATMCFLLQPQFTRSGREVRCKDYHSYEDDFEESSHRQQPVSKTQLKEDAKIKKKKVPTATLR